LSALEKAITDSIKIGIDECEIVSVKKNITTVRITDSEIIEIKQNFDENFGIRLIQNKKIASIQTTNEENISDSITKGIKINQKSKTKRILEWVTSKKRIVNS